MNQQQIADRSAELIMRYYEWLVQVFNTYRTALFG